MPTRNVRNRGYRARVSGNAAIIDALLLRLHTETACRRGGALGIRLEDLDPDRCLVRLREKGSTVRWQPITPALANCLVDHAAARGAILPTVVVDAGAGGWVVAGAGVVVAASRGAATGAMFLCRQASPVLPSGC
jgi:integrase